MYHQLLEYPREQSFLEVVVLHFFQEYHEQIVVPPAFFPYFRSDRRRNMRGIMMTVCDAGGARPGRTRH
jgi:hypothetical protein